ncbi:hypothetical protein [Mastigocoleus testarum]|uniref:Uncharacterized protein n=1 Tax=Mastigocoleus testarum BC008 TaxID=371196 RepID=A0A0V7ZD50_9CYAN|nr:hypothetical protein [Mastigocoleus testarum]KST62414.1 hypothetical protein BC008_09610 [Mastigocoleus testarum BC008]
MSSSTPLQGSELIDCARANMKQGIKVAAESCGYGDNINSFESELKASCNAMGIDVNSFADLISFEQVITETPGVEIAPDTPTKL